MVAFTLEKGEGHIELTLNEDQLLGMVTGQETPPLNREEIQAVITQGIPAHGPADLAQKKIAVIIPDDTRLWARGDLYVPCIIQALEKAGVSPEQIKVMVALGTHAPMAADRFPALAGQYTCDRVEILNSANTDFTRLADLGTTTRGTRLAVTKEAWEADHIIIYGGVLHHLIAGFGGGRKYILPGIAGYDTIQQNHALAFTGEGQAHPRVRQAVTEGNPVHEDMVEAARIFLKNKTCTQVALAANGEGQIFHCEVGDLDATFHRGCEALNRACCVSLEEKGDFALISAGGHRTDGQLYQSTKALFNAVNAVKEGGEILFVAACAEGIGNPDFGTALEKYRQDPAPLGKALAKAFKMPDYVAFRLMDLLNRFKITLVSDLEDEMVHRLGFNTTANPQAFIRSLPGKGYVLPFAENILPLIGSDG